MFSHTVFMQLPKTFDIGINTVQAYRKGYFMKRLIAILLGTVVLLAGVALVCYPFISNYLMEQNQSSEITGQQAVAKSTGADKIEKALKEAEQYNKNLLGDVVLTDPFDPSYQNKENSEYNNLLNLNNDSIMGSVEIPKINVSLPIFHGTSTETLEKGVGHLQNTSLPIGGKSTHSVLTGHTGLSTARLFTDLEQLKEGDLFFISVLNRKLAYKVDQIKVVLPSETKDLRVVRGKDYVTLVTCTPYGLNTHRLLVRGVRTDYKEAEKEAQQIEPVESTWMQQYKQGLIIGALVLVGVIALFLILRAILAKRKKNKAQKESAAVNKEQIKDDSKQ